MKTTKIKVSYACYRQGMLVHDVSDNGERFIGEYTTGKGKIWFLTAPNFGKEVADVPDDYQMSDENVKIALEHLA